MAEKIITYNASKTAIKFHESPAFVRGIMGPIGSGKSVACCMEMFKKSREQVPGPDGLRRTRWLVVRNTLPQLETTTIKTWIDWFAPSIFGRITGKPPYTHHISYGDVRMEVIFIALDKPEDVKKLLSFECTGIWLNEAREIFKEIVDAGTGRVGRYPAAKDGGCTWSGIIMDTNPPDDSHWWYGLAEEATPEGWEFFQQPSGLSPNAENIENLPENYYHKMMGGKTPEWINVYVHGKYGFIMDGKPVFGSSWNDELHTAKNPMRVNMDAELHCGIDSSGRNPAAIFGQKNATGQIQIVDEIVVQDMGAVAFSQLLAGEIRNRFPRNEINFWGDPTGAYKSQNDERSYFEIMRAAGINMRPAPTTNKIGERIQVVESALLRLVSGGVPALLVDKKCVILRRGFNGGYKFKRLSVSGEARYDPKPEKNRFSDPQDGLQYLLFGMGEGARMKGYNKIKTPGTIKAKMNFNV